jgi:hypothetical protein
MDPFKFELGDKVRDRITGMTGIVTARSEHLFGCERYWVEPQEMKDGKPVDGRWFDQDSVELMKPGVIKRQASRVVMDETSVADSVRARRAGAQNTGRSITGPTTR